MNQPFTKLRRKEDCSTGLHRKWVKNGCTSRRRRCSSSTGRGSRLTEVALMAAKQIDFGILLLLGGTNLAAAAVGSVLRRPSKGMHEGAHQLARHLRSCWRSPTDSVSP